MSEILLQTLVEKVTGFQTQFGEIREAVKGVPDHTEALQRMNDRLDELLEEVKAIPGKGAFPAAAIRVLWQELQRHTEQLKQPLHQEVRHEHHINRSVIVCIILGGIIFALVGLLIYTYRETKEHLASDTKYRYLKINGAVSPGNIRFLDSLYLQDPDDMRRDVETREWLKQEKDEASEHLEEVKKNAEQYQMEENKRKAGRR